MRIALAAFNLELREKGSGFVVVDGTDERLVAKASHIGGSRRAEAPSNGSGRSREMRRGRGALTTRVGLDATVPSANALEAERQRCAHF